MPYPWQAEWWARVHAMGERTPHALLLHGQAGIGKREFARYLAQSQLCEDPAYGARPCNVCAACTWFTQNNHPDYRIVRPEALALIEGAEADESGEDAEAGEEEPEAKKSRRAPSREIRIEQVRALADFLAIGTHRAGRRVVVVYPLEAMNVYTGNALLKMLEEPTAATQFILVADNLDRLLPTVISRCQRVPLQIQEPALALAWLREQGVADAERALAAEGGAPRLALANSRVDGELAAMHSAVLTALGKPASMEVLQLAERLGKIELGLVVGWLQRWMVDCIGYRAAGRIRYHPIHESTIAAVAMKADPVRMTEYFRFLAGERRVSEHPLNARLFFENLFWGYAQAMMVRQIGTSS